MGPSRNTDIDDRTLAAAGAGDRRALRHVHDTLAPVVLGYARGQRVEDPDVIANETMFRTLGALSDFDGDARRFRSWVFTVAHNLIVDDHRRRARRPRTVDLDRTQFVERGHGPPLADHVTQRLEAQEMIGWMADLTPDQRAVLLLRLVADLAVADVAEILGKRSGAVKTLHHRGLAALRRRLAEAGVTDDADSTFTQVT